MIHIPALRLGKPYTSLQKTELVHHATGDPIASVSQVSGSMIARDLSRGPAARRALADVPVADLIAMYRKAGEYFLEAKLPCGDAELSFDEYLRCLSGTTGSPLVFCRRNAEKVAYVLKNVDEVLAGLTRGLDLRVLDKGYTKQEGRTVSFYPAADFFGAILPSNSPGVHSLWVPAVALKSPIVLKPGREEPWTPFRVLQAFLKAGIPADALGFYPTDHAGAADILRLCGRSMLFGDSTTTDPYKNDLRVERHGPGFSKIILGDDQADRWEQHLDAMVESIAANGGRSCINVSAVWTPRHGDAIAAALAEKMLPITARKWDDPEAAIAAFANTQVADAINGLVDNLLQTPGATDVSLAKRGTPRLVKDGRLAWLLPTIVRCASYDHPLANKEFLFPFASVIECPQDATLAAIGPSLAVMALTEDAAFTRELLECHHIERLNLGPIPTNRLTWDQPHEGNLFNLLWRQRAFQRAGGV
ncbi:MAG: aldehyde dehydrogenase family protein [Gemmataceae bacterium]|nr:aldehyde dehydrogenase family protein [Gemmataceae bacterium]